MSKENNRKTEVLNPKLPFTPMCPNCGCTVAVEKGRSGLYVKCENCNSDWATSPFEDTYEEMKWIEKFHIVWEDPPTKKDEETPVTPPAPPPTNVKVLMEIAKSSATLTKAYELVCQAYDLINEDKVARKYIKFHSEVTWHKFVWDILMSQYNKDNPDSKEVYHLRAFNFYGIQPGMMVTDGCVDGQG